MKKLQHLEKLYVCVTADKYELPLFVAGSPKEMASFLGMGYDSLLTVISKGKGVLIGKQHGKVLRILA